MQIRYAGKVQKIDHTIESYVCKGVLVVDPDNNETCDILVRESMLKAKISKECSSILGGKLGIIEWSRPSLGRLGQQLLCLLTGSIPGADLVALQTQHLKAVQNMLHCPFSAARLAALDPNPEAWRGLSDLLLHPAKEQLSATHSVAMAGSKQESSRIPGAYFKFTVGRATKYLPQSDTKVQILLAGSRTFFGAAFPEKLHSFLSDGECVVMLEDGPLDAHTVVISRSPSYWPGDVRVLKNVAGNLPATSSVRKLRNCVFFSTRAARPEPDKMGGGDLDGDKFLVIWDPRILKYAEELRREPACYNSAALVATSAHKGDWIQYAALTDNAMLGVIERTFYLMAKQFGVDSEQSKSLNELFANLVDRIPASIDKFEKLRACVACSTQHPAGAQQEVQGNREAVWETMILAQQKLTSELRRLPEPREHDYKKFSQALADISCDMTVLVNRLSGGDEFSFHFMACLRRGDVSQTLCRLRSMPAYLRPSALSRSTERKQIEVFFLMQIVT